MIRAAQAATSALRYSSVPVVVCPAGMALGGGCEICLHGDRVQAAAESYIGLVEASVGLIPAAGGTKEMLARSVEPAPAPQADLLPAVQRVFETIGLAKVSTSGADAVRLGLLRERRRDHHEPRAADVGRQGRRRSSSRVRAISRRYPAPRFPSAATACWPPSSSASTWPGGPDGSASTTRSIGRTLATILAGGAQPHRTTVSEQHLLDLEREAFLKLCGEPKTLDRIQHTLMTGKPLRNCRFGLIRDGARRQWISR